MEHLGLQGLPRGLQGGVQFDLLHLLPDLLEEQEVDLVVGGQRQRAPADVDFRPQEHPCVQPAAVQHSGAIRLGGATMIGIGVDVDHLLAVLPEQFAQTARQRIGPEDHPAHLAGAAHTEQSGDKPATQAGAHHGDGDHQKHQGAQFQAPGQPLVRERGGEKGGHGRGDNAPRTDPGDEQPFPPGERGTPGAGENRCRPDQHHQGEHHEQPGQTEIRDLVDAHIRGQEDKEHADQQYGQLLLELHQVAQHIGAIVADDQAGHGHGNDAALRHQGVGGLEQGQDDGQHEHLFRTLGYGAAHPEQGDEHQGRGPAGEGAEAEAGDHVPYPHHRAGVGRTEGRLQGDHGHHRAHRVDQHPFGLEHGGHRALDLQPFQQRLDHGGAGDHDEGAEQDGVAPRPGHDQVGGRGGAGRGDQTAEYDQPADRILRMPEPAHFQVHAAFEENDRHREPGENVQRRAQGVGADHAQTIGTEEHAHGQQQDDARDAEMMADGLGDHAHGHGQGDGQAGVVKRAGCHGVLSC